MIVVAAAAVVVEESSSELSSLFELSLPFEEFESAVAVALAAEVEDVPALPAFVSFPVSAADVVAEVASFPSSFALLLVPPKRPPTPPPKVLPKSLRRPAIVK